MQYDEKVEVAMIFDTDAIVHPLTVMVESFDTLVAYIAMPRVSRADYFAFGAEQVSLKFFD